MRKQILNLPKGSLHLIMDIWTSKQKMSVIGIKAQFLEGWKIKLGIKPDDVNLLLFLNIRA